MAHRRFKNQNPQSDIGNIARREAGLENEFYYGWRECQRRGLRYVPPANPDLVNNTNLRYVLGGRVLYEADRRS